MLVVSLSIPEFVKDQHDSKDDNLYRIHQGTRANPHFFAFLFGIRNRQNQFTRCKR